MKSTDVDEMLGTPARLAILATVARPPGATPDRRWTFTALGDETGLADGNLHVQTRRLTEAGYLDKTRVRQGGRTVTCFELTPAGRTALRTLIRRLEAALAPPAPREPAKIPPRPPRRERVDDSRVW